MTANDRTHEQLSSVWVGLAYVEPSPNSHDFEGLAGGYGFIACRAASIVECVQLTSNVLAGQGMVFAAYEWLTRLDLCEHKLNEYQMRLVEGLEAYPVQFETFDWFRHAD